MECVGHTQKWLGTRLRNIVKSTKGTANPIHSKNKLTETVINIMQNYYGLAIPTTGIICMAWRKLLGLFYFIVLKWMMNPAVIAFVHKSKIHGANGVWQT